MTNKIKLVQDTLGSWTHIKILVDGEYKFHAVKQGTDFWEIVTESTRDRIGFAGGKSGVKEKIKEHLAKDQTL